MATSDKENSDNNSQTPHRREIKSFVVRSARMTESQQKAYDQHMLKWSLEPGDHHFNWQEIYANDNPVTLEIGFGMGDSLAQMAEQNPDTNYLGVEVHQAGVGRLLSLVEKKGANNIRVVCGDAVEVLKKQISDHSLDRVNIYFPDPWHKKRHHKRRLVQVDFINLLSEKLDRNGLIHIATDWEPYANHVIEVMSQCGQFMNIAGDALFSSAESLGRPETKFERRGLKLGHGVWDIAYRIKKAG